MIVAAPLLAELHDAADVLGRGHDARLHVRLLDARDVRDVGEVARILDREHLAVGLVDVVLHRRHRGDQVEVELALEPFLHDLQVQQAEEAAAEAEAERGRALRLVLQRGVVEAELLERVAEVLVLRGIGRIDAGEDHRADLAIARRAARAPCASRRGRCRRRARRGRCAGWRRSSRPRRPRSIGAVRCPSARWPTESISYDVVGMRAEGDLHPRLELAVHHADRGDRAAVAVVVRIEDQRAERRVAGRRAAAECARRSPRAAPGPRCRPWPTPRGSPRASTRSGP